MICAGTHWKTDGVIGNPSPANRDKNFHPLRKICALLFRISPTTVAECVAEYTKEIGRDGLGSKNLQEQLPEKKKKGRGKKRPANYRAERPDLFIWVRDLVATSRVAGNVLTCDKIIERLWDEMAIHMGYNQLRYLLLRMGFNYGRIQKQIKSGRLVQRNIEWLLDYCRRRRWYFTVPNLNLVHVFIDETFLHRDETGRFTWYLDSRAWVVARVPHTRWGIVQCLFFWWDICPATGGYIKRYTQLPVLCNAWNCVTAGNMNGDRFCAWPRRALTLTVVIQFRSTPRRRTF